MATANFLGRIISRALVARADALATTMALALAGLLLALPAPAIALTRPIAQQSTTDVGAAMPVAARACKVGRPAYCDKYIGVCESHAVGSRDCAQWYGACTACHAEAADCSGPGTGGTAACSRCERAFAACMDRSYRRHWPLPHAYKS